MRPGPRSTIQALALALALVSPATLAGPAGAQDENRSQDSETSPGELAAEAMDRLMRALDLLIGSIPQYEAPYVNEDGDIIIRRKRDDGLPVPEDKPAPPAEPDTTTT